MHGARYLHVLVTCPLGWGTASATVRLARLATQSGLFPVFEAEHGDVTAVTKIRRRVPVEEYLRPPERFAHLFGPSRDDATCSRAFQARADRNIETVRQLIALMHNPFAITLDLGSSLRQPHRLAGAPSARSTSHRLPPCNDGCPAGEDVQGWLYDAEERRLRARVAPIMEDNPLPAVMGRVCYHPCETACNRGAARRGGRHQLRRALPRRRGDRQGWRVDVAAPPSGSACSSSAPGRPASPPPTTWRAAATRSRSTTPARPPAA